MRTMPTVENAATWFNAKTVTHNLDVVNRQAEDGRLYAILKDGDSTREEPVEYGPADVTVGLIAPFAELVTATRPYSEDEADYLL